MTSIDPTAVSAREAARASDGRFGSYRTPEADTVNLEEPVAHATAAQGLDPHTEGDDPDGWSPQYRAAIEALASSWHRADRDQTMDPVTGGCPADVRSFEIVDGDDFASWSEDVANTPFERLSPLVQQDLAMQSHRVEKAVRDGLDSGTFSDVSHARRVAADATEDWDELDDDQRSRMQAQVWHRMGLEPVVASPAQRSGMVDQVAEHEEHGGAIRVDQYTGDVSWLSRDADTAPLYRQTTDPDGAPAYFHDGQPVAWFRGMDETRSIDSTGAVRDYHRDGTRTVTDADGSFQHFNHEWLPHRDPKAGPAKVDADGALYAVHGFPDRDPDDGPAQLAWDGEVTYFDKGMVIDPTPQQMARHGVERFGTPPDAIGWGAFAPSSAEGRYRAVGSAADHDSEFDWSDHPLSWGAPESTSTA